MLQAACSPFVFDRVAHGVATWGMSGVLALSELVIKPRLARTVNEPWPGDELVAPWPFDARLDGYDSAAWRRVSDWGCVAAIVAPVGVAVCDAMRQGGPKARAAAATEMLLLMETTVMANLFVSLLKLATRRPRPPACESRSPNVDYLLSFPSGHAATASSAAAFFGVCVGLRDVGTLWRGVAAALGVAVTGAVSYGRVAGSMHYFSDVLGGALLGSSVGFLVPWVCRAAR